MEYEGIICSGCGAEMHNDEDIVVCPECGTPQHRDCYNKNNCCVNAHLHAEGFEWKPPLTENKSPVEEAPKSDDNSNTAPLFEENMPPVMTFGGENADKIFMRGVLYDPNEEFEGIKVKEAATFIQQGSGRYIRKFMKSRNKKIKLTWNWAAFFFTPFWFFYRKMYKAGAVMLCLSIAITFFLNYSEQKMFDKYPEVYTAFTDMMQEFENVQALGNNDTSKLQKTYGNLMEKNSENGNVIVKAGALALGLLLIQNIAAALLADYLYKKKLKRTVELARKAGDSGAKSFTLIKNGGVSIFATLGAILLNNIIPSIIYYIADLF